MKQDSVRQTAMGGTDAGVHPAVAGHRLRPEGTWTLGSLRQAGTLFQHFGDRNSSLIVCLARCPALCSVVGSRGFSPRT